ncbi:hypothetical protein [Streptomyces sp. NPDC029526]|uniref:hypothetical protein n=1 Tax=Streptomyces sp. NPDC029526 TaxID=3155728 RepID=UPI0033CDEC57
MPDLTEQHAHPHDPRTCQLCATLRHPAQAKAGRHLAKHLADHPLPQQKGGQR